MCGIAGFIGPAPAGPEAVLTAMLDALAHRGPDDRGVWAADGVHLGQVRLSILDPGPRGHQPFLTPDGTGVLSYNGEVYNYRELRSELQAQGVAFHSGTDTEVVLAALHVWGPERAVPRLNGMFALAYLDRRSGSLYLARDRAGIKPLFVARSGCHLVFASEPQALHAHPALDRLPDTHALINLLLYQRLEGTMTPYRGVESVLPGTLLRIEAGAETDRPAPHTSTYFDPLRDLNVDRILASAHEPFAARAERLETLLEQSVAMHLASDVPLATMCSGGFDSSLVTAFASRHAAGVVGYVADVEGMHGEEPRRARLVADHLGVELRVVPVDRESYLRELPDAIQRNGQPLYFSQGPVVSRLARRIRADGYKVILTGDGADELFGGYPNHAAAYRLWRRRRWHMALLPPNRVTRMLGRLHPALAPLNPRRLHEAPLLPARAAPGRVPELNALLIDGARRHLREARLFARLEPLPGPEERAFLAASIEDFYVHLREYLRTSDRMTMTHGLENRVPFLENAVIDFGLHLAVDAKYRHRQPKRIVRALARRHLPASVIDVPKIGFGMSPGLWRDALPILDGGHVADLLKWRRDDMPDLMRLLRREPWLQFRLLGTELWLRQIAGGEDPAALGETLTRLAADHKP